MKIKNKELHDLCKNVMTELLDKLEPNRDEIKKVINEDQFWRLPATLGNDLENLESFSKCYKLIAQIDTLNKIYEGSKFYGSEDAKIDNGKHVLNAFLSNYFGKDSSLKFNNDLFEERYDKLEEYVYAEFMQYRAYAPLKNFLCLDEIKTSDGIILRNPEPKEHRKFYEEMGTHEFMGIGHILELNYSIKKERVLMHNEYVPELNFNKFVSALHLFRDGDFGMTILITEPLMWHPMGTSMTHREYYKDYFDLADKYVLTDEEIPKFVEFWNFYRDIIDTEEYKKLGTAIRRFNLSYQRETINDKIIDIMIGFESLFLTGIQDELKYRLSVYVAAFLGKDAKEKKEIFKVIKEAYQFRSSVVHGGSFPFEMEELKRVMYEGKFQDKKMDIINKNRQITDNVEQYLRESIKKFMYKMKDGATKDEIVKEIEENIF